MVGPEDDKEENNTEPMTSVEGLDIEAESESIREEEEERDPLQHLNTPLSCGEKVRDFILLRVLSHPFFWYLNIFVLIGVVASGALFFFFLMGWQTLCRPRTDCSPRNEIFNVSIQVLNVFFTYMATVSMPWRCANMLHTLGWSCPYRNNAPGHDIYGLPSRDVWYHLPLRKRFWILFILLLNCLTQYANQATRIVYYNYELADSFPGNLWTNVFFVSSMICAGIGGALMAFHTGRLRKNYPGEFGPGPLSYAKQIWLQYCGKTLTEEDAYDDEEEGSEEEPEDRESQLDEL